MNDNRPDGLLAWQWELYSDNHADRRNLLLHAFSNPLFLIGALGLVLAPIVSAWLALGGLGMVLALVIQGRGHRLERRAPVPFRSPADAVARFLVEQCITFPRYVFSGGFVRAWRAAR